jgi:hypothetical protein
MKVIVTWEDKTRVFDIDYNIGDVVKVTNYGDRWSNQDRVFQCTTFPIKGVPFDEENEIVKTSYDDLNETCKNLEWKIVDIGYYVRQGNTSDKLQRHTLVIRLRDRFWHELLMVYDNLDIDHAMKIVRKSKKEIDEYVININ